MCNKVSNYRISNLIQLKIEQRKHFNKLLIKFMMAVVIFLLLCIPFESFRFLAPYLSTLVIVLVVFLWRALPDKMNFKCCDSQVEKIYLNTDSSNDEEIVFVCHSCKQKAHTGVFL